MGCVVGVLFNSWGHSFFFLYLLLFSLSTKIVIIIKVDELLLLSLLRMLSTHHHYWRLHPDFYSAGILLFLILRCKDLLVHLLVDLSRCNLLLPTFLLFDSHLFLPLLHGSMLLSLFIDFLLDSTKCLLAFHLTVFLFFLFASLAVESWCQYFLSTFFDSLIVNFILIFFLELSLKVTLCFQLCLFFELCLIHLLLLLKLKGNSLLVFLHEL